MKELVDAIKSLNFIGIKAAIEKYRIDLNVPWLASHNHTLKSQTILHVLALVLPLYVDEENYQKIVDLFIFLKSKGLNINAKSDYDNETALHIFAKRSAKEGKMRGKSVVQIFVQQGADMSVADRHLKTPFNYLMDKFLNFLQIYDNLRVYCQLIGWMRRYVDDQANKNELLNKAIFFEHLDLAYYLLSVDHVDPNHQPEEEKGVLPLMLARSAESFELLFQFNVNVNIQGEWCFSQDDQQRIFSGITCAHFFVIQCQDRRLDAQEEAAIRNLKILSDHGANFNIPDTTGKTVLHYAVEFSLLKIVTWLVSQHVRLDIGDLAGNMPLDIKLHRPKINYCAGILVPSLFDDVFCYLTQGLVVSKENYTKLFVFAGCADDVNLKQYLLETVVIPLTDDEFFLALQYEVLMNHVDTVRYLLSRPNSIDKGQLLKLAPTAEMVMLLLDFNTELHEMVEIGQFADGTLLSGSVCHYYVTVHDECSQQQTIIKKLEALRIKGFDFNVVDSQGRTPLRCAMDSHQMAVAGWLVEFGVRLDITDASGYSDLDYYLSLTLDFLLVISLLKKGHKPRKEIGDCLLIRAAELENTEFLHYLLDGSGILFVENAQFNALKAAVVKNNLPAVRYLLTKKINLNFQGNSAREPTLLMCANTVEILETLLIAGADHTLLAEVRPVDYPHSIFRNRNHQLTVHVAHTCIMTIGYDRLSEKTSLEIVKKFEVLCKFGVNFNVQDNMGHTPFYYAVSQYLFDVAQWLMDHEVNVHLGNPLEKGVLTYFAESILSKEILAMAVNLIKRGVTCSQEDYDEIIRMLIRDREFEVIDDMRVNLHIACTPQGLEQIFETSDKAILLKLIELGLNINQMSLVRRCRFFMMMVHQLNIELVLLLIQHGINLKEIEAAEGSLFTYLFHWVQSDYSTVMLMVDTLFVHGADLNLKDKQIHKHVLDIIYDGIYGYSADKTDLIVDVLLEKGVDVCCCEEATQEKMVVEAVRYQHLSRIITILSKIADRRRKFILLHQIFIAAILSDNEEAAKYCLEQCDEDSSRIIDINAVISQEYLKFQCSYFNGLTTSLVLALYLKSLKVAALLISYHADIQCVVERHDNYNPFNQTTPLHIIVYYGLSELLVLALQMNPELKIPAVDAKREVSLLRLALRSYTGDTEAVVSILLQHDAHLYDTTLHDICARGYISCIRMVLSRDVDVHKKNKEGSTALTSLFGHYSSAPREKIAEMTNILLAAGAKVIVDAVNNAIESNCSVQVLQVLLLHINLSADLNEQHPLLKAMLCHRKELFDVILAYCRNSFIEICWMGSPLLHQALVLDDSYYADQLILANADLDVIDYDGHNILHVLASANQWDRFLKLANTHSHLLYQANNEGEQPWNLALFSGQMALIQSVDLPIIDQSFYDAIMQYLILIYREVKFVEDLHPESFLMEKSVVVSDLEMHEIKRFSYRLMSLFQNIECVKVYITNHIKQSSAYRFFQKLHDLCLFNLPMQGSFNRACWGYLAIACGENATKYLHAAVRIEELLKHPPVSLEEIQRVAQFISYHSEADNRELARLFKRHNVSERGFDIALSYMGYLKESDHLPDIHIEGEMLAISKRYYFKKLPPGDVRGFYLGALTSCCQSIGNYHGHHCALHGMTSEVGGFYVLFERPADPAKIRALLIRLENSKDNIEPVETFLLSIDDLDLQKKYRSKVEEIEHSILQGYRQEVTDLEMLELVKEELMIDLEDKVAAQCWAWRNQEGHLVLDSWESKHRKTDKFCERILKRAAEEMLTEDSTVVSVSLGGGGHTPSTLSFPQSEVLHSPDNYQGYRDSKDWQYLIDTQEALQQRQSLQQATEDDLTSARLSENSGALFSKPPFPQLDDVYMAALTL